MFLGLISIARDKGAVAVLGASNLLKTLEYK